MNLESFSLPRVEASEEELDFLTATARAHQPLEASRARKKKRGKTFLQAGLGLVACSLALGMGINLLEDELFGSPADAGKCIEQSNTYSESYDGPTCAGGVTTSPENSFQTDSGFTSRYGGESGGGGNPGYTPPSSTTESPDRSEEGQDSTPDYTSCSRFFLSPPLIIACLVEEGQGG